MKINTYIYWLPRVLGVLFILFLALFALDVFIPGKTIGYYFVALFIHLIPNFVLLALLLFSWKYEKMGGVIFILLGVLSTVFFFNDGIYIDILVLSFPIFVVGMLFLLHSRMGVKKNET